MSAKLVTIGDSLTQGFLNGSISKTHLSYPAMIAECLGDSEFKIPDFSGAGGLPLNLEALLNHLDSQYGSCLLQANLELQQLTIGHFVDTVEDYWERGPGTQPSTTGPLHRNLAVWGFQLPECDTLSDQICQQIIPPAEDHQGQQPEFALHRTARRTLNPSQSTAYESLTQIDIAQKIADAEGIDNLIFWLGSNHCLDTVVKLNVEWSTEETIHQPIHLRTANLWRPEHFKQALHRVASKVSAIGANNVFVSNVPHITIPPVSRGVTPGAAPGTGQDADGYFEYYTHFWIWDEEFDPAKHPHLTRSQVKEIDAVVDEYNQIIQNEAAIWGWHLVDTANVLDRLAFRRQQGKPRYSFPPELVVALRDNPKTQNRVLSDGTVLLDTRYLRMEPEAKTPDNLYKGGLFGLDGLHPTTLGYGLIAHEFLQVMQKVGCEQGNNPVMKPLDWEKIIAHDSLLTNPPASLTELRKILAVLFSQPPTMESSETPNTRGLNMSKATPFKAIASLASPSITSPSINSGTNNVTNSVTKKRWKKRGPDDQSGSSGDQTGGGESNQPQSEENAQQQQS